MKMRSRHYKFWHLAAAAACGSSVAFLVGSNWSSSFRVFADSSAGTLVLPTPPTSIPTGPTETNKYLLGKLEEEIEFWKKPSRAAEIMRFGYPGFDNLRTFEDFIISYDRRNRTAHWVMEHLSPERMAYNPEVNRANCLFSEDLGIHPHFRSRNEDYKGSGYDRGHLAPAANHRRSQLAMNQTFLLTNMSPQVGKGFNRDKWNELEKYIRHLAKENMNLYICTGPLYLPKQAEGGKLYVKYRVIGANRVAVPTHFFKAVLLEKNMNNYELEVYLLPNEPIPDEKPLKEFLVNLDTVEIAAGFLIFDKLPKGQLSKINGKVTGGGGVLRMFG